MQPLNFDRHLTTWWREVKADFWGDMKPECLKLVKTLLEASLEYARDEHVLVDWNQKAPHARADYRNGYYTRSWATELGVIDALRVPRTRHQAISHAVLQRFRGHEAHVHAALRTMFLAGVSTRRVGEVVKPFLGRTYSATFISHLTKALDPHVRAFHQRRLTDDYRYLLFDGIVLKGKAALGTTKRVILVAYGLCHDGRREVIDFLVERSESQAAWERLVQDLYRRGLEGHETALVITDGSQGLHAALDIVYPRVPRQRCWVHKLRNVATTLRRSIQEACLAEAKGIYRAATHRQAVKRFQRWAQRWEAQAPKAVACLQRDLDDLLRFLDCPAAHHRMIRTTNGIERIFREVRRRTRPMSCFTNEASIDRILYGLFTYFNDRWRRRRVVPLAALAPPPAPCKLAA